MYSFDAFTRLWEADGLFVRHWLPLPQLPIMFAYKFGLGLLFVRYCFAFFGVFSVITLGIGVSRILKSDLLGMVAAILLGTMPNFFVLSVVPYQEGLMFSFIGLFLIFSPYAVNDSQNREYWLAGMFLALAALCRYEAWIFMGIVCTRFVLEKKWRVLKSFLPAIVVPPVWIIILQFAEIRTGPPRYGSVVDPISLLASQNFSQIFNLLFDVFVRAAAFIIYDLLWVGYLALVWGIICAKRLAGFFGREMLVFFLVLFLFIIFRGMNSHGVLTARMFVPLNFITILIIVAGVKTELARLKRKSVLFKTVLPTVCLLSFCVLWTVRSYGQVKKCSSRYAPEAYAANLLKSVPEDERVLIKPRRVYNIWLERLDGAIFAQAFGELDHRDKRWIYTIDNGDTKPDYELYWSKSGYVLDQNKGVKD